MSEVLNLNNVKMETMLQRARKFVPLHDNPVTIKVNWKSSPRLVDSTEHSGKEYEDNVTILSNDIATHVSVLQTVD